MQDKPQLFIPIEFWTHILKTLDGKIEIISKQYGHGKVTVSFSIQNGAISQTSFIDEVRPRALPGQPTPRFDTSGKVDKEKKT